MSQDFLHEPFCDLTLVAPRLEGHGVIHVELIEDLPHLLSANVHLLPLVQVAVTHAVAHDFLYIDGLTHCEDWRPSWVLVLALNILEVACHDVSEDQIEPSVLLLAVEGPLEEVIRTLVVLFLD